MDTFTITGNKVAVFAEVDKKTCEFMEDNRVSGAAIAIVKNQRLIFARGYTRNDLVVPHVLPTSTFRLASLSKLITRVAVNTCFGGNLSRKVAPLVGLATPPCSEADKHWPDVTLQHLYDHSSGLGSVGGDIEATAAFKTSLPATKYQVAGKQITNPFTGVPGKVGEYSNYAYALLGIAIEKQSGLSYEQYVKQTILAPLGITRAFVGQSFRSQRAPGEVSYHDNAARRGKSAFHDDGREVDICYGHMNMPNQDAFGGWVMSAPDFGRFLAVHGASIYLYPTDGSYAGTRTFVTYDASKDLAVVMLFNEDGITFPTAVHAKINLLVSQDWSTDEGFAKVGIPPAPRRWINTDLTTVLKSPPGPQPKAFVRGDSAFSVHYRTPLGSHYELVMAGGKWKVYDFTQAAPAPDGWVPEGYVRSDGVSAVVFLNRNRHVIEVALSGGAWHSSDLTAITGAPRGHGDAPMGYVREHDRITAVVYRGSDHHIHELALENGAWRHYDLTVAGKGAPAYGTPYAFVRADGISVVVFKGEAGHVHELSFDGRKWFHSDLTAITLGATMTTNRLMGYVRPDGCTSILFTGANGHIQELTLVGGSWSQWNLTAHASAPPMISSSGSGEDPTPWGYVRADRIAAVLYAGEDKHLHELTLVNGSWHHGDLTTVAKGVETTGARGYVRPDGVTAVLYSALRDRHIHQITLQ